MSPVETVNSSLWTVFGCLSSPELMLQSADTHLIYKSPTVHLPKRRQRANPHRVRVPHVSYSRSPCRLDNHTGRTLGKQGVSDPRGADDRHGPFCSRHFHRVCASSITSDSGKACRRLRYHWGLGCFYAGSQPSATVHWPCSRQDQSALLHHSGSGSDCQRVQSTGAGEQLRTAGPVAVCGRSKLCCLSCAGAGHDRAHFRSPSGNRHELLHGSRRAGAHCGAFVGNCSCQLVWA